MSTPVVPLVVTQLGRTREREPRESLRAVPTLVGSVLAAAALAGAVSAPLVETKVAVSTEVVRAVVVGTFALAGAFALSRRPAERQPILALLATALAGAATACSALIVAHAHGTAVSSVLLSFAHVAEPVALALFPVAAMHFLLGLPDGSCRLSRAVIGIGYLVGTGVGIALWARRPSLPLWPILVEQTGSVTGPPIVAGGFVWAIGGGGNLEALSPTSGAVVRQFQLGSEANHFPTPSAGDGRLFAPASNRVVAFAGR
jgi:hypothetical protein